MTRSSLKRTVARLLSLATLAATPALASAEAIRIVSPAEQESVEGDRAAQPSLAPNKLQFLFPASDFASLPASQRWLVAFNPRGDQTQTEAVDWVYPDTEIWISTTEKTSGTLSTAFAENHGPDKTLVFDGARTQTILGTGSPRDFADGMRFQTPFYYDPSLGNLLVERIDRGGSLPNPSPTVDVQSQFGFTGLAGNFDVDAELGTLLSNLPVTQFEFVATQPGDYNVDGTVDAADYVVWRDSLGQAGMGLAADGDGSGDVDEADYTAWSTHFGQSPLTSAAAQSPGPGRTAVPEPSTFALASLGIAVVLARLG